MASHCARPGCKHHLLCNDDDIPLKMITTGGYVNNVSMALDLVASLAPVARRPERPRRLGTLPADKGPSSHRVRGEPTRRRIIAAISARGSKRLGKLRCLVAQTLALLHPFQHLTVCFKHHPNPPDALLFLACPPICRQQLKNRKPRSC